MDTILHQIPLMDQVENEQELSEIIHSLLQAIGNYTGADRVYVFDWERRLFNWKYVILR